jgi:hypothetical protein
VAAISGVTVRRLHHYDEIGLLAPAHLGANGYRCSGRADLYLSHPDFVTRDETNAPRSAVWLTDAMKTYALPETQASAQRGGFEQANAALVLLS